MMTSKILIIGGGRAARRYVESLFWNSDITICGIGVLNCSHKLSEQYNLDFVSFYDMTQKFINSFSCVIVALPVEVKIRYVKHIIEELHYNNTLIIEKPLCINSDDLKSYKLLLKGFKRCSVVCQRDFDLQTYNIHNESQFNILFPTFTKDTKFNLIHMLPHVLSWLYTTKKENISIKQERDNKFVGYCGKTFVSIEFVPHKITRDVIINNIEYPKVQYRNLNSTIVNIVENYTQKETKIDLDKAFYISSIIAKLLKE